MAAFYLNLEPTSSATVDELNQCWRIKFLNANIPGTV